jgi:hypothetical protein
MIYVINCKHKTLVFPSFLVKIILLVLNLHKIKNFCWADIQILISN